MNHADTAAIAANAYAALARLRDDPPASARGRRSTQDGGLNFGSVLKDVMQCGHRIGA